MNRGKCEIVPGSWEGVMVTMIVYSSTHYPWTSWTIPDIVEEVKRSFYVVNRPINRSAKKLLVILETRPGD